MSAGMALLSRGLLSFHFIGVNIYQLATIRSGQKSCGHHLPEVCISWLCVV